MTLSVKTRFEVFKRDRFTCQYCGKHPPDVLLEADHILPHAAGGSDDMANLTTACSDCNRGKGARMLEEGTGPAINVNAVAEMQERLEQAKAYMETLGALESLTEEQIRRVNEAWAKAFGATAVERDSGSYWVFQGNGYPYGGEWPDERSVKRFIKKLGLEQVLDAVDITASRFHYAYPDACRYFYGVCHRSIREGREPLSEQVGACDGACGYPNGKEHGRWQEHERIKDLFINHEAHGFAVYADVVNALWPEDD